MRRIFHERGQLIPLSGHYKWALDQLFYKHNFSRVIILEGEMGHFLFNIMHFPPSIIAGNIWNLIEHLYPITDDMEIAPDFFDYFEATATLLDKDKYVFKKRDAEFFFFRFTIQVLKYLKICVYNLALSILGPLWLFPHGMTMDRSSLYMIHVSSSSFVSV